MKKHLIYLLAVSPLLCFGGLTESDFTNIFRVQIYTYSAFGVSNFTYTSQASLTPETVPTVYYSSVNGIRFSDSVYRIYQPNFFTDVPTNQVSPGDISFPVHGNTVYSSVRSYWPIAAFSKVRELYVLVTRLYASGYRGSGFKNIYTGGSLSTGNVCLNFYYPDLVADIMSSTNSVFQSLLLSHLNTIGSNLQNIHVDVGQLQTDYTSVNQLALNPSSFSYNDMPMISGSSSFSYEAASVLSDPYISPAFKSQFAANLGRVYGDYLSKAAQVYALDQSDPNSPSYGKSFSDFLSDSAGVSKSMQYQYSTPLTNGMQRMTTDWKNAVTNDLAKNTASITNRLAQNTASITNQLAQWKRDLHDDVGAVGSDLNSVIISGDERPDGKSALRVDANVNIGELNIAGDIHIDPTQVETLTEGFGDEVSAAVHDWILEWRDWAYDNPDSWSEFYRRFYSEYGPDVITNQLLQISLLTGITNELHTAAWTNELVGIISNGVAGLNLSITNELWDYYFDRFKKSNEFKDDSGAPFSLDLFRQQVFGGGFDESKYRQLDWFSRVELLLYQIGYASTNDAPEFADLDGEFDDMEEELSTANSDFVAASVKVVSVFALVRRFADSVALAFQSSAAPSTGGIVLLNGGSWLVNEPLLLKVPIQVQNAMRLVFQCIWYLSAFVIAWRILMIAWGRIVAIVRWLWSVFDV